MKKHLLTPYILHTDVAQNVSDNVLCNIYITTPQMLEGHKEHLTGFDLAIIDESHVFKNRKTKASKALAEITKNIQWVILLTGTPYGNASLDFYSQFNIMDKSIFGNWTAFEKEYTHPCGYGGYGREIRQSRKKKYMKAIQDRSFFLGDVCSQVETEKCIYVNLSPVARTLYDRMQKYRSAQVCGLVVYDQTLISSLCRLHQMCGGYFRIEDRVLPLEPNKMMALAHLIAKHKNEKLVIFARYLHEIRGIKKMLTEMKFTHDVIQGSSDSTVWYDFQDKKDPQIMVCQIKSGGTGIELSAACVAVYYSNSYSYIDYDQSRKRLNRKGQTKEVTLYHLLARDTVDEMIYTALHKKMDFSEKIFQSHNNKENIYE